MDVKYIDGRLIRTDSCSCSQALNVDWDNLTEGNTVGTFKCGCISLNNDSNKFDVLDDGTIALRCNHDLVLGTDMNSMGIRLVKKDDKTNRLVFRDMLQ